MFFKFVIKKTLEFGRASFLDNALLDWKYKTIVGSFLEENFGKMSDYEDEFMCDEDEDYDLEYSEDSNSEPDVDLENQYYNSKALKEEDPKAALESFQRVLDLENGEKGEWGFKALKQMIKINFRLQNFEEMMRRYKQLLTYIKSAVTRNHSEKSINSILDYISTSKQMELLQVKIIHQITIFIDQIHLTRKIRENTTVFWQLWFDNFDLTRKIH